MALSRRFFLKSTGVAVASFAAEPSFLLRTALAQNSAKPGKDRPILVAIFQRAKPFHSMRPWSFLFNERSLFELASP